jgi:glutathione S-transferase
MHEADNHLSDAQTELFEATLFRNADAAEDAAKIAAGQDKVLKELSRWDGLLIGEYLAGPLSLADFGLYPYVRQIRRIDERQPKNGLGDRMPARLRSWMQRIEALPYYAKTIPPHWKG